MFKFLRKYNKWILAVGGTLLMIVFLIPQAIEGLSQSAATGRVTRATLVTPDGRSERVTGNEWAEVFEEYELLDRIQRISGSVVPGLDSIEGAGHWYLLTREAEAAGLIGPPGAIDLPAEQLMMLQNMGLRVDVIRRTMPKLEGVGALIGLYQGSAEVSDHRLREWARRMFHRAEAELVVLPASADEADKEPTEQELAQHLELYGDVAPEQGPMGFGYRLPDRVKLEWLSIPAESVREAIRNSDQMNSLELRRHWSRGLRDADTPFPPQDPSDPSIPDIVREDLLEKLTTEQLEAIAKFANDTFRATRRGLTHIDGYVVLPDDWRQRQTSMTDLAEQIQSRFGIETPAYHASGENWLEMSDLPALQGIGRATTDRFGTTPRNLRDLVENAKEFGGSHTILIQESVAGPPMRSPDGGVHVFRIIDADPSRAPRSVDEVRDQLAEDLKRLAHYEQLLAQASQLEQQARTEGLLSLAIERDSAIRRAEPTLVSFSALQRRSQVGLPMIPEPQAIPLIGVNREATEAIIDRAMQLPTGEALAKLPAEQRIFAVPVEDRLALMVVQIRENFPLTSDEYLRSAGMFKTIMVNEQLEQRTDLQDTFGFESLVDRYSFVMYTPAGEAQDPVDELEAELALGG